MPAAQRRSANSPPPTTRPTVNSANSVWVKQCVALLVEEWGDTIKRISDNPAANTTAAALTASCTKTLLGSVQQKLASGDLNLCHSSKALGDLLNGEVKKFFAPLLHFYPITADKSVIVEKFVASTVDGYREIIKLISNDPAENITAAELSASCKKFLLETVQKKLANGDLDLRYSLKPLNDLLNGEVKKFFNNYPRCSKSTNHCNASSTASAQQHYEDKILTRFKEKFNCDLASGASKEDIEAAYRQLALKVHPDKGGTAEAFINLMTAKDSLVKKYAKQSV